MPAQPLVSSSQRRGWGRGHAGAKPGTELLRVEAGAAAHELADAASQGRAPLHGWRRAPPWGSPGCGHTPAPHLGVELLHAEARDVGSPAPCPKVELLRTETGSWARQRRPWG
jgi:hypothetical protein